MGISHIGYDQIKNHLSVLSIPTNNLDHKIEVLVPDKLAVGRGFGGNYEIFFLGDKISPTSDLVRQYIKYSSSLSTVGSSPGFKANLLSLPASDEFSAAVSMIAMECIEAGIETRDTGEFLHEIEPIIELVLSQQRLPGSFALGLYGELFVLRAILDCKKVAGHKESDPTRCWKGAERTARDFKFEGPVGSIGVEVKTTLGNSSLHTISGLDQVELRSRDTEIELHLASIGIKRSPNGDSISDLTDSIVGLVKIVSTSVTDDIQKFMDRLKTYGPVGTKRYDHSKMKTESPFIDPYEVCFNRLYNMIDSEIKVIREACLKDTHVETRGISYRISLEESIPGSVNNPCDPIRKGLKPLI